MADYKPGDVEYPTAEERKLFCKFHYKGLLTLLIPIVFLPLLLGREVLAYRFIYVSTVMYLFMILNLLTPGATAFIYIVFLPICGIMGSKGMCVSHYSDLMYVTYGAFWIGITFENSKMHRRWGIFFLKAMGPSLTGLQLALMVLTTVLSFLIDATMVSAVMMKVALAIMDELDKAGIVKSKSDEETYERGAKPYPSRPAVGMYLTVCFSASIGNMLSPFQEPNQTIHNVLKFYLTSSDVKPTKIFNMYLLPAVVAFIVVFIWINIIFMGLLGGPVKEEVKAGRENVPNFKEVAQKSGDDLGPMSAFGLLTIMILILGSVLIFTRNPLLFNGWQQFFVQPSLNSVPVIFLCLLVFALPANYAFCSYYACKEPRSPGSVDALLLWKTVHSQTPWHWIFFMGAAYVSPIAATHAKFYDVLRDTLIRMKLSSGAMYGTFLGTFLTIFSPSRTVAQYALPEMVAAGHKLAIGPGGLAVPFAMGIQNSFMLPCSSASNIIVAGWGNVRPLEFILGGIVPEIIVFIIHFLNVSLTASSTFPNYASAGDSMSNFTLTTLKPA